MHGEEGRIERHPLPINLGIADERTQEPPFALDLSIGFLRPLCAIGEKKRIGVGEDERREERLLGSITRIKRPDKPTGPGQVTSSNSTFWIAKNII